MIIDHRAITHYIPYRIINEIGEKVRNPKFDATSGLILDIKQNGPKVGAAKAVFLPRLLSKIKEEMTAIPLDVIATIPGHKIGSSSPALVDLTKTIAARLQVKAMPYLVSRTKTIDKLAHGGDRSLQVHFNSMTVTNHVEIGGKSILLIDDVRTTGNSLIAAAKLLVAGGARVVHLLAIGQTSA